MSAKIASFGRKIDAVRALRDARRLLTPRALRSDGVYADVDTWRLARAQWHYDYGNRALAERELEDINAFRESRRHDGRPGNEPMDLRRSAPPEVSP